MVMKMDVVKMQMYVGYICVFDIYSFMIGFTLNYELSENSYKHQVKNVLI